jgi:hypothetical protein
MPWETELTARDRGQDSSISEAEAGARELEKVEKTMFKT